MDNILKRKAKLEKSKAKIIEAYEFKIKKLDKYIAVLKKSELYEDDNVDTIVFKLYMQLDNVSKVANEVNELGYRIRTMSNVGERKHNSNDITAIITNADAEVEEDLKEVVQEIQKMNYGKVAKRWF